MSVPDMLIRCLTGLLLYDGSAQVDTMPHAFVCTDDNNVPATHIVTFIKLNHEVNNKRA